MRKNVFQYSSIKRILFTVAVGLCLIGATTAAKANVTAYYESNANTGTFGTIDLNTGVATPINTTNGLSGIVGLGVYNGNLYAAMNVNNIGQLFSINTATGIGSPTPNNMGVGIGAFGSTSNGLFAYSAGFSFPTTSLASINPLTGVASPVGNTGTQGAQFPLFSTSSDSGLLYKYDQAGGTFSSINTTTGAATLIANNIATGMQAMLETNGILYAIVRTEDGAYRVDTITAQGVTAPFGTGGSLAGTVGNVRGLAPLTSPVPPPSAVPVPATMQLLGSGLVGLAAVRKFKR